MTETYPSDVPGHYELRTLPELESFLPIVGKPMDAELEKLIKLTAGPEEAISVWFDPLGEKHNIIIDGHRRYAICKCLNLPFKVKYRTGLKTIEDAKSWMAQWQISRRNLTPFQHSQFIACLYDKTLVGEGHKSPEGRRKGKNTAKAVAKMTGLAVKSVEGHVTRVRKVEALVTPLKEAIMSSTIEAGKDAIGEVYELPPAEQHRVLQETLASGKPLSAALGGKEGIRAAQHARATGYAPLASLVTDAQRLLGKLVDATKALDRSYPNRASTVAVENSIRLIGSHYTNWGN